MKQHKNLILNDLSKFQNIIDKKYVRLLNNVFKNKYL